MQIRASAASTIMVTATCIAAMLAGCSDTYQGTSGGAIAFDDMTSTFTCADASRNTSTSYGVTFSNLQ